MINARLYQRNKMYNLFHTDTEYTVVPSSAFYQQLTLFFGAQPMHLSKCRHCKHIPNMVPSMHFEGVIILKKNIFM